MLETILAETLKPTFKKLSGIRLDHNIRETLRKHREITVVTGSEATVCKC
jgi:hypothetical protein